MIRTTFVSRLARALRRDKIRVLFAVKNGFSLATAWSLIEELLADRRFVVRLTPTHALTESLLFEGQANKFAPLKVDLAEAMATKWDYILHTHLPFPENEHPAVNIYTPHGGAFGNKPFGNDLSYSAWVSQQPGLDVYWGLSSNERTHIESKLGASPFDGPKRFVPVGYFEMDKLIKPSPSGANVLARYGLDTSRRTILLTSTFGPISLFATFGAKALERLSRLKCNVICTGHPHIWTGYYGEHSESERELLSSLREIERSASNVRVLQTLDLMPLLKAADVFVADHTSVMPTYNVLGKPSLFYLHPKQRFTDDRIETLYKQVSRRFEDLEELEENCSQAFRQVESRTFAADRSLGQFVFGSTPGHAVATAKKFLLNRN